MRELESMSAAVREVIDAYPAEHEFFGNELKDDVVKIYPDAANMYPDTILRMARRHRRYAFCVVDQNNSLYKKIEVKPIIEQIKEAAPKPEPPPVITRNLSAQPVQGSLFATQGFLFGFFFLVLGLLCRGESAFGCPLTERFFNISISVSESSNIAFTPMYRDGVYPARSNLLRVASVDTGLFEVLILWLTSNTDNSIPHYIGRLYIKSSGKWLNVRLFDILLYKRIVVSADFFKILENSLHNLDRYTGRV